MGADLEGSKEEGNRPPPYNTVRVEVYPYDHDQVQDFLVRIRREFPKWADRDRWSWTPIGAEDTMAIENVWIMDFHFRDIEDAIIFGLKYSR